MFRVGSCVSVTLLPKFPTVFILVGFALSISNFLCDSSLRLPRLPCRVSSAPRVNVANRAVCRGKVGVARIGGYWSSNRVNARKPRFEMVWGASQRGSTRNMAVYLGFRYSVSFASQTALSRSWIGHSVLCIVLVEFWTNETGLTGYSRVCCCLIQTQLRELCHVFFIWEVCLVKETRE